MAKLIAEDSNRVPVTMDQIPTDLANAFVAIEDERFTSTTVSTSWGFSVPA